jgi:predicted nucleic acid-binding protein
MNYFDSSALVKRYAEEAGTDFVKSILSTDRLITTSKLIYPEILIIIIENTCPGFEFINPV